MGADSGRVSGCSGPRCMFFGWRCRVAGQKKQSFT